MFNRLRDLYGVAPAYIDSRLEEDFPHPGDAGWSMDCMAAIMGRVAVACRIFEDVKMYIACCLPNPVMPCCLPNPVMGLVTTRLLSDDELAFFFLLLIFCCPFGFV